MRKDTRSLTERIKAVESCMPPEQLVTINRFVESWSKNMPKPVIKREGLDLIKDRWVENVNEAEAKDLIKFHFKTEKDLCDFIESNIEEFTRNVFNLDYISHIREYDFDSKVYGRGSRVDFFITTNIGNILVECKNDKDLTGALSQLLGYHCIAKNNDVSFYKLALITTHYNDLLRQVVYEFNLPVDVFVFNKEHCLRLYTKEEHASTKK